MSSNLFKYATARDYCDAMADVFTDITNDVALLDLRPVSVQIGHRHTDGCFALSIHFTSQDVASVDRLAEAYDFAPDCTPESTNYTREGRLDVDGRRVLVGIFTGRPEREATDTEAVAAVEDFGVTA